MPFIYANPRDPKTNQKSYNAYKNVVEKTCAEAYTESFVWLYEKGLIERCEKDNGFVEHSIAKK